MDVNDISQMVRLLFLRFDGCFQFRDLDNVVGGQRERGRGSDEGGDVPLTLLAFWHMRKAGQEVLEEFEDLPEVGFVEFKSAVESSPIVLVKVEIEAIEVWNAAIHTLDHSVLKLKECRVVKWNPDVAGESRGRVVSHWPETKLKFVRL
jgi:hypothetical protein